MGKKIKEEILEALEDETKIIKKLKKEINQLMKKYDSEGDSEKLIDYLGWWWRNMDEDSDSEMFSHLDGKWWLDCAGKWDYPTQIISGRELINILKNYRKKILKKLNKKRIK